MKQLLIIFHLCLALFLIFIIPVYSYAAEADCSAEHTFHSTALHSHSSLDPKVTGAVYVE